MHFRSSRQKVLLLGGLLAAWLLCAPVWAGMVVKAKVLQMPGARLSGVTAQLGGGATGKPLKLKLHAARVDLPLAGWHGVDVTLDGTVRRLGAQTWQLDADVRLRRAPGGLLSNGHITGRIDTAADTLSLNASQGRARVNTAMPLDMPSHAQIHMTSMPLSWLQGLLARSWQGKVTAGRVSGNFAVDILDSGARVSGQFDLGKAAFDSKSGTLAGQDVSGTGRLHIDTTATPTRIDLDSTLKGGQMLLGPLYAQLPSSPVRLTLRAATHDSAFDLRRLHFDDPGALKVDGSMAFGSDGAMRSMHLTRFSAQLPAAYRRYGKAFLQAKGLGTLKADGSLEGSVDLATSGLRSFHLQAHHVDLQDSDRRLSLKDLDGAVAWSHSGTLAATSIGWKRLDIYQIPNGAAQARLQSRNGTLQLLKPLQIPVLGGQLGVASLAWKPSAAKGQTLSTALTLSGIDLPKLCRVFGWPAFPGTLAGSMPGLEYHDQTLVLHGGLSINAFHGFVDVTRMSLKHPFGDTPELTADMHMDGMDLKSITSVFDFGSITGTLHGKVQNVHLVDWKPVAFDASLVADDGGRISQRAVNHLTEVGGGGVAGGLQGLVLKVFSSFGYSKIALSCKLEGKVCRMGGIKPVDGGFLIVEGSGLPHLSVIGHQRQVSWPTLISRLKAATSGGGPVVN